jgi:hypothetical protein
MGQAQIDAMTPSLGLMVYNTTTLSPNYYDGTQWRNFNGTVAVFAIGASCLGGKIAYILQDGDPGYNANVIHGLIATLSNQSNGAQWGCYGTEIQGADNTDIGAGKQNTIDIVAGCSTAGIAAKLCSDMIWDGYSDWYLPSRDELNQVYISKDAIAVLPMILIGVPARSVTPSLSGSILAMTVVVAASIIPIRTLA